ncbi:c-type cytochrome [Paenibacillus albiflavus]|uniref:C-type cytochrome n=1 Tax=Paenibacillus albiflavus TaxID=2545760 RepID=A0A4R4ELQ1_9BACL|nr:c-type cytochrome [Paenibacillus albiflavus]TCZ81194.1 c-type cytochrome [Paenibacillus albiflavus]
MAHGHKSDEKIIYVGDSRVVKKNLADQPVPADYTSYPGKSEVFIPNFLLKEWMVAVVALVGVLCLVMSDPAPLGRPADPLTPGFIPMPDWYFLFMYQLLKYPYASGDYKIVGTLILPAIMFGALLLAPFLDTGKERRFYRRPIASSIMLLSIAAVTYLTVFSWHHYQQEVELKGIKPEHSIRYEEKLAEKESGVKSTGPAKKAVLVSADDPAYETFKSATCVACHATDLKGSGGPSLLGVGDKYTAEELATKIKDGSMKPHYDSSLQKGISNEDMDKMIAWLATQKKPE